MLFNSFSFLIFFIIVTGLYFILPHKFRWFLLLISSCIFYMSFIPIYILILFLTIIVDYTAGIFIEKSKGKKRLTFLIISLISTISILFVFKYYNFFIYNYDYIINLFGWNYSLNLLKIVLPIGLSFHTFQSMAYVIEVYRGKFKAEYNFGIYALYVMFYPQLVAGPIERPQNLIHQFYEKHEFEIWRVIDGIRLMLWGLFKKVVIADRLAVLVNIIYDNPTIYSGSHLIVATIFFAFQIYCDFSGYSDMAIGAARVMGFKLMDNFKSPYFSKSIPEFWRRWHISLSSWFKDYVYIPLGGSKVGLFRYYYNLFIVFLISGFWHGANWTFIIWGGLHGIYMVLSNIKDKFKLFNLPNITKIIVTFVLVGISWVFFRANSLSGALYILKNLLVNVNLSVFGSGRVVSRVEMALSIFFIIILIIVEYVIGKKKIDGLKWWWIIYLILIWLILVFGVFGEIKFIYFQF